MDSDRGRLVVSPYLPLDFTSDGIKIDLPSPFIFHIPLSPAWDMPNFDQSPIPTIGRICSISRLQNLLIKSRTPYTWVCVRVTSSKCDDGSCIVQRKYS